MHTQPLDPTTASVIENGLFSIAEEMATVILRTAYSSIVRDLYDFSVALCNASGEMVAQGAGVAIHLGCFPTAVAAILNTFRDDLEPGDVYIMNDPYEGGMHLPNVVLLAPIFVDADLLGHAVALAHHTDVGGAVPGSVPVGSREVFAEGLRIPPMVLERHGVRNQTLLTLLKKNVRLPRDVFGDLNAQITSCRLGEQRLQRLAGKYGVDAVQAAMTGVLDRSERMARAEIAALPDGDYPFEDYLVQPGLNMLSV